MDLSDAGTLAVMRTIPSARCHELTGDLRGELAVDVSGNYPLIFEPDHDPLPQKADGGLDWDAITHIRINRIEDYH
jgi:proteic killer suppression protein